MSEVAPIPGLCERDIDLLLVEEFLSSPAFLAWFAERAGLKETSGLKLLHVERSRSDSTGESDVEVTYKEPSRRRVRLLLRGLAVERGQARLGLAPDRQRVIEPPQEGIRSTNRVPD
jgi:hypothetical protein